MGWDRIGSDRVDRWHRSCQSRSVQKPTLAPKNPHNDVALERVTMQLEMCESFKRDFHSTISTTAIQLCFFFNIS